MPHILYGKNDGYNSRVICERPNWKTCPEHKHLTNKMPKNFLQKQTETVSYVEKKKYASGFEGEEQAMYGMRQAYNNYRAKERRNLIINTVAGFATTGVAITGIVIGFPLLFVPLAAWAGWNFNKKMFN